MMEEIGAAATCRRWSALGEMEIGAGWISFAGD